MNVNDDLIPPVEKQSFFMRYAVVIGAFLAMVNGGIVIISFGIFFKPVSTYFDWTRAETSGAASLATVMSGIVGIIAGRLGDRFNPRIVIIVCGTIEGLAFLLLSQMTALWQLYLFYGILVGAGMANVVPASSLVARSFQKKRGLMSGIALAGAPVGSCIAPPLATALINHYNWSVSYTIIGILALVFISISGFCLFYSVKIKPLAIGNKSPVNILNSRMTTASASPVNSQQSNSSQPGNWNTGVPSPSARDYTLKEALRSWPFWLLGLIFFCAYFAQQDMAIHIVPHLTDINISATSAALVLMCINIANILGNFTVGMAVDRISSRQALIITMILLSISSIILLVADPVWSFFVFAVFFGLAWGGTSTLRSTMIAEIFGLKSHGALTGIIILIVVIGGTISPLLTGYVFDVSGQYTIAFILIACLSFLGLGLALILKRSSIKSENRS